MNCDTATLLLCRFPKTNWNPKAKGPPCINRERRWLALIFPILHQRRIILKRWRYARRRVSLARGVRYGYWTMLLSFPNCDTRFRLSFVCTSYWISGDLIGFLIVFISIMAKTLCNRGILNFIFNFRYLFETRSNFLFFFAQNFPLIWGFFNFSFFFFYSYLDIHCCWVTKRYGG